MVHAHAASKTGPVRTVNEDSSLIEPGVGVYAVADGMGGHNAGEVASALALDALASFMRRSATDEDMSWPYGIDPGLSLHANRLRTAIHLANRRVFREAENRDDYSGMGTTIAVVLVTAEAVVCAHVGDSRIYRLSKGAVTKVTHDDSWAAALQSQGITTRDLARHPMRHVLTNVVGARDQVDVHVLELPRATGDRYLICSDGLHEVLGEADLTEILVSAPDVHAAAERLVATALERGSRDNVTALVVHCEATS
jgi:serine/threonine protein phosphatase PrpC